MSELSDSFEIARVALNSLESDLATGCESPEVCRAVLVNVIAALSARLRGLSGQFELATKAGNPNKGVRFDDDEMRIIASLPNHGGSMEKSAKSFWGDDVENMDSRLRKLYRIKRRVEKEGFDAVFVFQTLIDED